MTKTTAAGRRTRDKRKRRDAILDAAEQVFGAGGAAHATMEEVAEAASVSKGTLYLYFESKDDLVLALTHRPLEAVLARFEALRADDSHDGLSLLSALMEAHATVVNAHAPQLRLAMAGTCGGFATDPAGSSLSVYAERVRTLRATYLAAIERGIADGSLRTDLDARRVSAGLWAAMFGATFLGSTFLGNSAASVKASLPNDLPDDLPDDEPVDLDGLFPITMELLLAALRRPERPR